MRVVEPSSFASRKPPKKRSANAAAVQSVLFVALFFVILTGLYLFASRDVASPTVETAEIITNLAEEPVEDSVKSFAEFTGDEFRLFYDNLLQENTELISLPPEITNNQTADTRILEIAKRRGYLLRTTATVELPYIDGYQLQAAVHQPWRDLKSDLASLGATVTLVSGHREIDEQRTLFLERLNEESVTIQQIADGLADREVDEVLIQAAPPGYSKHHSGYTVDMLCGGFAFRNFKESTCHDLLVANNYELARKHGFLPSYPADADLQGPEPEAWEYVWVGDVIM